MDENDEEYEYEETVVLVELNGIIDPNFLLQEQAPTKILGIETEEPILQIGHYIFSGQYEDTLGTVVAYEPITSTDKEGKEIKDYKFVCKTDNKLSMKRIFLQEKASAETDESLPNTPNDASEDTAMDTSEHSDTAVNKQ